MWSELNARSVDRRHRQLLIRVGGKRQPLLARLDRARGLLGGVDPLRHFDVW